MTTIFMKPDLTEQTVSLSDGGRGFVTTKGQSPANRYYVQFPNHAHPNFWCNQAPHDGMTIRVNMMVASRILCK